MIPIISRRHSATVLAGALLLINGLATAADPVPELPIRDFFKHAEFTDVTLSPKGNYMSVTVPQDDRTQLAVFKIDGMELVGKWDYGAQKHINDVTWANDDRFIMQVVEKTGSFDTYVGRADLYASNVDGTKRMDIPNGNTYQIVSTLPDEPRRILVSRAIEGAYLSKLDIYSGKLTKVATAPIQQGGFVVDRAGNPRYAIGLAMDGMLVTLKRDGDDWETIHRAEVVGDDVMLPIGFNERTGHAYVAQSEKGGAARIYDLDPETNERKLLASDPVADPGGMLWTSDGRELIAVAFDAGIPEYAFVDAKHDEAKLYAGLLKAFEGRAVELAGSSDDGRLHLVRAYSDVDPGSFYLYDKKTGQAKFLLANREWIKGDYAAKVEPIELKTRDGEQIRGYLTTPRGSDRKNLPMVMFVHGGPHGPRDTWGWDPVVQFLANRGYAVMQMNYRGSGGFGRSYESSGYRKWGTMMQDDLTDATQWAIRQGIVDADRICIFGGSYGGYAALMSVVREPDLYQCTIGYVGVYSLPMMKVKGDIPETTTGQRVLDRYLPEDLAELHRQSPAYNVERIKAPVMLIHGAKDRRVPIEQMEFLISQMAKAGKKPEVVVVEKKEGHGFFDVDNNVALYEKVEAFLDRHIGEKSGKTGAANSGESAP